MKRKKGILVKCFSGFKMKILASFLLLTMFFQVIYPTAALALTSGPTQPEFTSFEPVNTTQLVDNFTGDFNYNIPLLTVPGPNGGYPINLAYHAGIGMEDEASWVGLGWNLNVGEINRQVRGLPDDFNGDAISKATNMRPNWTLGVEAGVGTEILGKNLELGLGLSVGIFYNSYRGLGVNLSPGISVADMQGKDLKAPWQCTLELTLDSQSGAALNSNIGMGGEIYKKNMFLALESTYSSRAGLYNIGLGYNKLNREEVRNTEKNQMETSWMRDPSRQLSFLGYVANNNTPTTTPGLSGFTLAFTYKVGAPILGVFPNASIGGHFSTQFIVDKLKDYKGYGYLYLQNASNNDMMDYNREKQFPVAPEVPSLPIPVMTHDIYSIKGQGTSGMFRAHRSDYGFLHEPATNNNFGDVNAGIDAGKYTLITSAVNIYGVKDGTNGGISYGNSYSGPWKDGDGQVDQYKYTSRNSFDNENNYRDFYFKNFGEMVVEGSENGRFNGYALADLDIVLGFDLPGIIEPEIRNRRINTSVGSVLSGSDAKKTEREIVNNNIEYFKVKELRGYTGSFLTGSENIYASTLAYGTESSMNTAAGNVISGTVSASTYDWQITNCPASSDQVGAMRVRQDNGMVYEYGLPAYNMLQRDVLFSIGHQNDDTKMQCDYDNNTEEDLNNSSNSRDQYYSRTETPPYAHSYLLTAVYSPDYVDITGDGPTPDDMGYYTKFNYARQESSFHWRTPFRGARFEPGFISDDRDDKAAYSYGEKEIYYLHSVETKTHMALFFLEDREDGYGPAGEDMHASPYNVESGKPLKRLRQIRLYKKPAAGESPFLLKTVNFEYNYSLCKGVYNNSSAGGSTVGKLTLTKVYFTNLQNSKGSLSPYQFVYGDTNHNGTDDENGITLPETNPSYTPSKMDRWGNYKSTTYLPLDGSVTDFSNTNFSNEPEPYVKQEAGVANNDVQAWNLTDILLPSGGKISVDYESDDYAYVQDKKAMQMFRIIGTLGDHSADYIDGTPYTNALTCKLYEGDDLNLGLLVRLSTPTSNASDINKYLAGIDAEHPLYFKTYMRLKRSYNGESEGSDYGYDYVEGFCHIDETTGASKLLKPSSGATQYTMAYIKLKDISVKQKETGGPRTHPFSKASWEYMKVSRADLLYPDPAGTGGSGTLDGMASVFVSMWGDLSDLVVGYYKRCRLNKYGQYLMPESSSSADYRPSYVRLNSPYGIKYGGGHRVKALKTTDNWKTIADEGSDLVEGKYGMEFSYRMKDGTSSGVAAYEPLIGGEEIPLRMPSDRYSATRTYIHRGNELYVTEPQGESFFPAPVVGYRRVIARNSKNMNGATEVNKKTQSGIVEYEYYTAKDFPVVITKSDEVDQINPPTILVPIPGVFTYSSKTAGYSMGFKIELNNMHGQLRRVTTYPYETNVDGSAPAYTARTEYIYNTVSPFTDAGSNKLSNAVQTMKTDGTVLNSDMGVSTEFYTDMQQNASLNMSISMRSDHDWGTIVIPTPVTIVIPYFFPTHHYSGSLSKTNMRYVVTNKIINRHGILNEVRTTKDGNTVKEKNLVYDYYTGQPLLTTTTNEFDQPVYSYNYKGHWYYENMGSSYKNYDYSYTGSVAFTGGVSATLFPGVLNHLHVGDKVLLTSGSGYVVAWISNVNTTTNQITCIDDEGDPIANGTYGGFRVMETIHRNLQSVPVGKLVTLNNPLTAAAANSPLFASFNTFIDGYTHNNTDGYWHAADRQITKCNGQTYGVKEMGVFLAGFPGLGGSVAYDRILFYNTIGGATCETSINIDSLPGLNATNIDDVRVYYHTSSTARVSFLGTDYYCPITFSGSGSGCEVPAPCTNLQVLHAEAATMKDDWDYNYADAGDPYATVSGFVPGDNPWRSGKKGTWRVEKQYLFQVARKQNSPTNVATDGTYDYFSVFDWAAAATSPTTANPLWTNVNTVTRYSPYGYELENRDVLGIYSSALYGYDNSLMTAMGANTSYFETAFDGFEDYASGSGNYVNGHGHIKFSGFSPANNLVLATVPHTGKKSFHLNAHRADFSCTTKLAATSVAGNNLYFIPHTDKQYTVTCWVKPTGSDAPAISVSGAGVSGTPVTTVSKQPIEGWYRLEATFQTGSTASQAVNISVYFGSSGSPGSGYLDDFRIQPFNSAMKTYAYDPNTLWLMAELDDRNYATFYNYDEEGNLVQVKKETERGVKTIQTGRKNVRRNL